MRKRPLKIAGELSVQAGPISGPEALPVAAPPEPSEGRACGLPQTRSSHGDFFPFSIYYLWIEEITMAEETKHGGHKNGKKGGLSGSSFFTWFMVIALLGVWTSVAVVWFDLVDYEEVLAKAKDFRYNFSEVLQGKLGIYDADGDGDFDVDDAKVLLAEGPGGVAKRKAKAKVKELTKEELKKEKEKLESRKESKHEERKKGKKEKEDDRKDKKIADSDLSRKESPKGKKDREKEKMGLNKGAKTKESRKKSTHIKDFSSKTASKDDRKESSSHKHAHLAKGNNQKRKN
uniref:Aspartate beta-hydroxylase n=1 Tax=Equus asinus TaxID=9793 RepID=A0A9L0K2D3_EQUAS